MTSGGAQRGDFHNHLVPGVDDGSRTLDDALEGVGRMVESGFARVIATPHLEASRLAHDRPSAEEYLDRVGDAFGRLEAAIGERFPELDLRRGHEVRLDVPTCDLTDERVRLGGTRFVLVEWARFAIPPGTVEAIEGFAGQDVRLVIAHPERYANVDRRLALVREWKRAGAFLQMNYGSLVGRYGPHVQSAAFSLLRAGVIDYFCTDFHGRPHLSLHADDAVDRLREAGAVELIDALSVVNPGRLFRDELPLPTPAMPAERGFWRRLREAFR